MEIIAKKSKISNQTQDLKTHTEWVLNQAFGLTDEYTLDKVSKIIGVKSDTIKDLIFFSCYFHDLGKATLNFKNTIENGASSNHARYLASLLIDFEMKELKEFSKILIPIIVSHHRLLDKNYVINYNFDFLKEGEEFFNEYKASYEKILKKPCSYDISLSFKKDYTRFGYILDDFADLEDDEKLKLKILYAYVSGILNLADWLASAKFEGVELSFVFKECNLTKVLQNKFMFQLRDFQKELSCYNENVLVEIPTGEGKTEGSLLWAVNLIKNKNTKIIYTLPTQATSNKLYERVCSLFCKDECGLVHSGADVLVEEEYDDDFKDKYEKERLFIKSFNKPITVCTIDSYLYFLLNYKRFNIVFKNYLNSILIIDEIHSYDFKLLGFLKSFFKLAKKLDIKICIMSATLPKKTKEYLEINDFHLIRQDDLFDKQPNKLIKKECLLEDDLDFVLSKQDKNILIIKNTVNDAIRVYEKLKNSGVSNIMLYHSRFKKCDKAIKENQIFSKPKENKPFILVATQIVEVSFDIDFDVMFSDNAPIDALIQRFGRVNRKKSENLGEIFIYKTAKSRPYNENILDITFKNLQNGLYSLKMLDEWLNLVYDEVFVNNIKFKNNLFDNSRKGERIFDDVLETGYGILKNDEYYELRDIKLQTQEYLLYDDFMNEKKSFKYTVSFYANQKTYTPDFNDTKFKILNPDFFEYSLEFGLKSKKSDINLDEIYL
ncbi:CRISPR-associated helicase/endonuclease Cas3 [Campylobacter geochelonis]|uniref:CRISPR-associated helicase/endonuclease Cas3 n=1 Tax=Campylobacter geochelonis TaxID=1780362 RepID=UPI000770ABD0|nr:CRISPR-associated helicase/endonuclease Cas3 [Campylobacter geochelonis]CZE47553.1 DEAD/DEAH box helicase domain-containing protein [Campylobacter geochelonis]CZE50213.1 DEAD/DEAH box helicase domain-containing protein [Campylobacter geochelonis]